MRKNNSKDWDGQRDSREKRTGKLINRTGKSAQRAHQCSQADRHIGRIIGTNTLKGKVTLRDDPSVNQLLDEALVLETKSGIKSSAGSQGIGS